MDKFFHFLTTAIAYIQIALFPTVVGAALGAWLYFSNPTSGRLWLGILIGLSGLIFGLWFAAKINKKHGAVDFISKVSETPDIKEIKENRDKTDFNQ